MIIPAIRDVKANVIVLFQDKKEQIYSFYL